MTIGRHPVLRFELRTTGSDWIRGQRGSGAAGGALKGDVLWGEPRFHPWPSRFHPTFVNLRLLVCPNDVSKPATYDNDHVNFPADAAPRSYMINGWNDLMAATMSADEWEEFMAGLSARCASETQIRNPSDTCLLGEKMSSSPHFFMDLLEPQPATGAVGNDLFELDRSRHGGSGGENSGGGGSNYAFADGSARRVSYGEILWPENLWAVTKAGRQDFAVSPQ